MFSLFLAVIVLTFFYNIAPAKAMRAEIDWPDIPGVSKQIKVGGNLNPNFGLPDLVKYLFNFLIVIGGLAAFFKIIYGGIKWMTSAGNPTATKDARDHISSALLGLLLILASYLLLKLVNPDLLILKGI